MPETRAQKNRAIRQEALREQLQQQGHVQHIVDILEKLKDPKQEVDQQMTARYKIVIDSKLKLLNKYLPDLKATEVTGPDGEPLEVSLVHYGELDTDT